MQDTDFPNNPTENTTSADMLQSFLSQSATPNAENNQVEIPTQETPEEVAPTPVKDRSGLTFSGVRDVMNLLGFAQVSFVDVPMAASVTNYLSDQLNSLYESNTVKEAHLSETGRRFVTNLLSSVETDMPKTIEDAKKNFRITIIKRSEE